MSHDEMIDKWENDLEFKAKYEAIEEELSLLSEITTARKSAGLTRAQLAELMGTKATAITRMESNLASGVSGPSFSTLKKLAKATGKKLQIRFV